MEDGTRSVREDRKLCRRTINIRPAAHATSQLASNTAATVGPGTDAKSPCDGRSRDHVTRSTSYISGNWPVADITQLRQHVQRAAGKQFSATRQQLAELFLLELDRTLTSGFITRLVRPSGGVKIEWNRSFRTTAGRVKWSAKVRAGEPRRHEAVIELSDRIVTDVDRLLNVVAHEYCHLANFAVSRVLDQPHGQQFREWGRKCSREFRALGIRVKTTHNYV